MRMLKYKSIVSYGIAFMEIIGEGEKLIMINPTTNELLKKVDSAYTLCNVVSKRARQLVEGAHPLTECNSGKPVSIAAKEVCEGKVTYDRIKSVPKKKCIIDESMFESGN